MNHDYPFAHRLRSAALFVLAFQLKVEERIFFVNKESSQMLFSIILFVVYCCSIYRYICYASIKLSSLRVYDMK
jgi:hypothetical protein